MYIDLLAAPCEPLCCDRDAAGMQKHPGAFHAGVQEQQAVLLGLVRSSQAAIEGLQATLGGYGERRAAFEGRQPQPAGHLGGAGAYHLPACSSVGLHALTAPDTCWLLLLLLHGC